MLLNYSIAFLLFCQSPWVKIVLLKFLPHRLLPSSSFWGKPYTTKQPRLHGDFPRRRGYFKCLPWVVQQHARPCILHHLAHGLAHFRVVAGMWTGTAKCFLRHPGAVLGAPGRILSQLLAFTAQRSFGAFVLAAAIQRYHLSRKLLFHLSFFAKGVFHKGYSFLAGMC